MRRNSSYNADLDKNLQASPAAVREFLIGLTEGEDGLELSEALKHTIKRMGIKEFCTMTKIPMPNVIEFLKGKRQPKPETLQKYLKPFKLKAKLTLERAS